MHCVRRGAGRMECEQKIMGCWELARAVRREEAERRGKNLARISRRISGNDVPMGSRHVGSKQGKSELCCPGRLRSQESRMSMCASIYMSMGSRNTDRQRCLTSGMLGLSCQLHSAAPVYQGRSLGGNDIRNNKDSSLHFLLIYHPWRKPWMQVHCFSLIPQKESTPWCSSHFRDRSQSSRPQSCKGQCWNSTQPHWLDSIMVPNHPRQ